jgi:hypothetical protein
MTGRPINEDRQNSIALGLMTYTGTVHRRCGTNIRYVSGGGCVHCARVISAEQREARKYLLQQEREYKESQREEQAELARDEVTGKTFEETFGEKPEDVLDNSEKIGDDAKARRDASIDELM